MSILDHPLISQRYFFPRFFAVDDPTWVEVDGARLACHARRCGHPFLILHFHGNGEVVADYVPDFEALCDDLGADCFLAEYRGYGESTGEPRLHAMLDDVDAIFEAAGRPPEEVIVFGRSVGSIYAIELASRYPVAGLILESGIADPGERVLMRATPAELGTTEEVLDAEFRAHLDNAAKLADRTQPTLVMHTRNDSLVDASHATRLASFPRDNTRLVLFGNGDHNTIFGANLSDYVAEMRTLLELCASGRTYDQLLSGADDTLDGGITVFDDTREMGVPRLPRRSGPGHTKQLEVPDALRNRRLGPGDTQEAPAIQGEDE